MTVAEGVAERKRTILLVEDERIIALSETVMLEHHGYRVVTCATGERAVELAINDPEIDLVLMDINLGPGIDGTQAAEMILAERELPVVFLSSHTESEVVEKTETITSYGYIVKNTGETVLTASVKMAFNTASSGPTARVSTSRSTEARSSTREASSAAWSPRSRTSPLADATRRE